MMDDSEISLIQRCSVETGRSFDELASAWKRMETRRKAREAEKEDQAVAAWERLKARRLV